MPQFTRTWWGNKFIEALETFTDPGRLGRGRSYARGGKVKSFKIDDGVVTAEVRGSVNPYYGVYTEPLYKTQIEFQPISQAKWAVAIAQMASKASFISRLLLNEMPDNIEDAFSTLGLHLLPHNRKDFKTSCSCPDDSNPCKHIAGVYYLVAAELDKVRTSLPRGTPIEIWFQDEARIGQKNKITRRWAKRGTRPSAPHDQRTKSAYIFGAICPQEGKAAGLVLPCCNTEAMNLHLAEISLAVAPGAHAVLLMDQAGWHTTSKLDVPRNISIIALPSKSPELNPQENIWQFMRDNWLSNRVFTSYEDIVDHCCEAWNKLVDQPWKIMSIGLRDWANEF